MGMTVVVYLARLRLGAYAVHARMVCGAIRQRGCVNPGETAPMDTVGVLRMGGTIAKKTLMDVGRSVSDLLQLVGMRPQASKVTVNQDGFAVRPHGERV